jgi:2-polyprenyl-3-methyl-5-hydroxy-6-metoxy-1,4-benzoquinol methylase
MQYDPIKKGVGRFFSGPALMRRILYFLLDLLLLRTWHVNKELRKISKIYPNEATILDAGTGFGQYAWRMARKNKNWKIRAIDIDPEHIESNTRFIKKSGLSDRILCDTADLLKLDETSAYDFILCVDVMEHIEDDELVLRNFRHALKEGGSVLISTPSDMGGSDVHTEEEQSFIGEHVRDGYSIEEISRKLENANFSNIKAIYTYGKPGNISWHLTMKYPVSMLGISSLFYLILPFYYLLTLPLIIILNIFDLILTHRSGTGLLVSACK